MYPEYQKVKTFFDGEANALEKTDQRIEDIFNMMITHHKKNVCCMYVNSKGKIDSYKYEVFGQNTAAIASAISQILTNKEKHHTVVLKLTNGPHWGETFYGILMAGYKPVLVDARLNKEGTQNLINQSKAIAIITDDVYEYEVQKISLEDIKPDKKARLFARTYKPTWEDECLFCSSGTTGDIKLMVYNGRNLVAQICAAYDVPEVTKDLMYPPSMGKLNILAMLPMHHIFGFVAVLLWFGFFGKTLVYPASQATKDLLYICQKCDVTHVFSVPLLWDGVAQAVSRQVDQMGPEYTKMLDSLVKKNTKEIDEPLDFKEKIMMKSLQKKTIGTKIRYCISGGGYLSEKTSRFINGIGFPLYNGYGMTEVGVTSVEQSPDVLERLKCFIGTSMHAVQYKLVNTDKDNPNVGELCIKSPIVHVREIIGGVEQPATLDEEGYFHTGDIAQDTNGKWSIKGRIKDIIINADGENVFPDEVEFYFKKLPHVTNLSVLGIKKGKTPYEDIVLVLEVENTTTSEEFEALKEEINTISGTLPKGIKINDVYVAKGKLPLSSAMKVKKFQVKRSIEDKTGEYTSMNEKPKTKSFEGFTKEEIEEVRKPLRAAFSRILYLPEFKIADNGHWINDLGGDSMSYVELLQFVEQNFDVKIPEELYGQLTCVDDFCEEILILKKEQKDQKN